MRRLLIVESDRSLREELSRAMSAAGYVVDEFAPDSAGAQDELLRRLGSSRYDAAILDWAATAEGRLLERLERSHPLPTLLVTSSLASTDLAVSALGRGVDDFLRKPFRVEVLESRLHELLESREGDAADVRGEFATSRDPAVLALLRDARRLANSDVTLQIVGEHGTGKRWLARQIHRWSGRRSAPFVPIDCSTICDRDGERELFGWTRGGPIPDERTRRGLVGAAAGGTLVLRGIDELPLRLQKPLLRALQERPVESQAAGRRSIPAARIVATSQRQLAEAVAAGRVREDLHYRLDVVVLRTPSLRDRPQDIGPLARELADRIARRVGCEPPKLGDRTLAELAGLPLRGNVRELENLMRRAVVLFPGAPVELRRLLSGPRRGPVREALGSAGGTLNLREIERHTILRSLAEAEGNRTHASRALGISVRTLRNKIREYGLA